MKSKITLPLLIVLLLLTACGGQPQISLETNTLDFGDVVNGTIITEEITVTNTGTEPLQIESVATSCGCTKANITPEIIQPGEQGILHIEFDSGAHGPDESGELNRQIFIASNIPDQEEVIVEFVANVLLPEEK